MEGKSLEMDDSLFAFYMICVCIFVCVFCWPFHACFEMCNQARLSFQQAAESRSLPQQDTAVAESISSAFNDTQASVPSSIVTNTRQMTAYEARQVEMENGFNRHLVTRSIPALHIHDNTPSSQQAEIVASRINYSIGSP